MEKNLRIKRMEICKNLSSLRSWIVTDLGKEEKITFFIEEDCEEEYKITACKIKDQFIVYLGNENLGKFFEDELFSDFINMVDVDSLKDIPVFKINLMEA